MPSPQLISVINVYDFMSTFIRLMITKRGRMVEQLALILPFKNDDMTTKGHAADVYSFISLSINLIEPNFIRRKTTIC